MSSLGRAKTLLLEDADSAWGHLPLENVRGRSVLVTGASGLLGTHFLAGLLRLKYELAGNLEIHAAVRSQLPPWFSDDCNDGRLNVHCGDLSVQSFVDNLPRTDIVIHSATYSQPSLFTKEASSTIRLNTSTTLSLLDRVRTNGRFLFISSSEVYSGLSNPPHSEWQIGTTDPTHPRACYIESKRCGEAACLSYGRDGVQAKIARLCLAYGPGTRAGDTRVMNALIERALRERMVRLLDAGSARRTYSYISDAMYMLWRVLFHGKHVLYNVGGKRGTSIRDLADLIARAVGVPVNAPANATPTALTGAPQDVSVDISRFEEEFGNIRFVPAEIGVQRTIMWQRFLYGVE